MVNIGLSGRNIRKENTLTPKENQRLRSFRVVVTGRGGRWRKGVSG